MAHQNAGKEHRKRCQGSAQHVAVKLSAYLDNKCIYCWKRYSVSLLLSLSAEQSTDSMPTDTEYA